LIILTYHAEEQIRDRNIPRHILHQVIEGPQQIVAGFSGRQIHQSEYFDPIEEKSMLMRVILENQGSDFVVITVYKTSKIAKYRSEA
jgi:hypothetical protein